METQPGGKVESRIGVMHLVDAPEQRDLVAGHVLEPDGKVEHDESGDARQDRAGIDEVKEPPLILLGHDGCAERRDRQDDPEHHR